MSLRKNQFKIPILLLTWKRQKEIKLILNTLKKINAINIYVNSDGFNYRSSRSKERDKIIETRNCILKKIDWDCRVYFKFNNQNLGCKKSVISAINWFFENEESGIILEEDCIPNESFFYFCADLLAKYKNNKKISCITGVNFQNGQKVTSSSYYFSKYNHCWGWATWRESWDLFDADMSFWPNMKKQKKWDIDPVMSIEERKYWMDIFESSYKNYFDSWAYPWLASLWYRNKLTITPELNLVSNVGFDGLATHTKNRFSISANKKTFDLENIIYNSKIEINLKADNYTFKNHFCETANLKLKQKIFKKIKLILNILINPKKGILYIRDKIY